MFLDPFRSPIRTMNPRTRLQTKMATGISKSLAKLLALTWILAFMFTTTVEATLPVNANDQNAFAQLTVNLNRGNWKDCNATSGDICFVCSSNTMDHSVTCENIGGERRITGLRFRNLGIVGSTSSFGFFAFTALKTVDLSSDLSKPFINEIVLPSGETCTTATFCSLPGAFCDFGLLAPICVGTETRAPSASNESPEPIGLYVGVSVGVVVAVIIFFYGIYIYTQRLKRREEYAEAKVRKERRNSRLAKEQFQQQQQQQMMMHTGYPGYPAHADVEQGIFVNTRPPATSSGSISAGGSMAYSNSLEPPRAKKTPSSGKTPRKSFTSLRTRRKSNQKSTRRPSQSGLNATTAAVAVASPAPSPQQEQWVQQFDAATGAPYWINVTTGLIRGDNPNIPSRTGSSREMKASGSQRTLVHHGSSKNLKRPDSSKSLKGTGSMRRLPAGPPPGPPPNAYAPPNAYPQPGMMMMTPAMPPPPPGMVGPPGSYMG